MMSDNIKEAMAELMAAGNKRMEEWPYKATDDAGGYYCTKCGNRLYTFLPALGRVVPSICPCMKAERDQREAQKMAEQKKMEAGARRAACFGHATAHFSETWANDDPSLNPDQSARRAADAVRKFSKNFETVRNSGRVKGFLLAGSVGSGKSYLAAAACNSVIDQGYSALFTNVPEIAARILNAVRFGQGKESWNDLLSYDLIVVDDLFSEAQNATNQDIAFRFLDQRINQGKQLIVTANMELKDLNDLNAGAKTRIYDRLLKLIPMTVSGRSIRRAEFKDAYNDASQFINDLEG